MKRILFALLLISGFAHSQSTYYIRADSTRLEKIGGNNELVLLNGTRSTTGVLVNYGNGRTRFSKPRINGDTLFIGVDTILGVGSGGAGVPTSRTITTTSPLTGGGDLSANRTFSILGLSGLGTAGQLIKINSGATGFEYFTPTYISSYTETDPLSWKKAGNAGTTAGTDYLGTSDAIDLVIKTNNTEKLRVESGGDVGIGIANPTTKLEVKGSYTRLDSLRINNGTAAEEYQIGSRMNISLGFPVVQYKPVTTNKNIAFNISPSGTPGDYSGNGIAWLHVTDTDVSHGTGNVNTAVLGIASTYAEVGVRNFGGTSKPFRIVVNSDTRMNFTTSNTADFNLGKITQSQSLSSDYVGYSLYNTNNAVAESNAIFFFGNDFGALRHGYLRYNNGATSSGYREANTVEFASNTGAVNGMSISSLSGSGKIKFTTTTDGTNHFERMRIDSAGNVGIGTSSPSKVLHTIGTVRHATLGTASSDTTTYKPMGINSSGDIIGMTYWPGKILTAYQVADAVYTSDATLNNTDLSVTVVGGGVYQISGDIFYLANGGGVLIDFDGGSATFTDFRVAYMRIEDEGQISETSISNATDLSISSNSGGSSSAIIYGYFQINAGGTVIVRSSQSSSNASSSTLYRGSNIRLTKLN